VLSFGTGFSVLNGKFPATTFACHLPTLSLHFFHLTSVLIVVQAHGQHAVFRNEGFSIQVELA
jgi:hypothetical protein